MEGGGGGGGGGAAGTGGAGSNGHPKITTAESLEEEEEEEEETIIFAGRVVARSELMKIVSTNDRFQLYVRRAEMNSIISFQDKLVKVAPGVDVGDLSTVPTQSSSSFAAASMTTSAVSAVSAAAAAVSPHLVNGAEVSGISGMLDFSATSSVALDDSTDRSSIAANGWSLSPAPAVLDLQNLQPALSTAATYSPTTPAYLGIDDFPSAFGEVPSSSSARPLSPVQPAEASANAFEDLDFSLMAVPTALTPEPNNDDGNDDTNGGSVVGGVGGGGNRPPSVVSSRHSNAADGRSLGSSGAGSVASARSSGGGNGGGGARAASTPTMPASPGWTPVDAHGGGARKSSKRHKLVQWDGADVKVTKYRVVKPPFTSNYVLFVLAVCDPFGESWLVERRYSDFEKLHKILADLKFTKPLAPMPGKSLMKLSDDVSRERMVQFQRILDQCIELEDAHNETHALKQFLSQL